MVADKNNQNFIRNHIKNLLVNKTFHRTIIGLITLVISFFIIETGAAPIKYNLHLWDKITYDITAPKDIENTIKTKENAENAAAYIEPSMGDVKGVPIDVLNKVIDIINLIQDKRGAVDVNLKYQGVTKNNPSYSELRKNEQRTIADQIVKKVSADGIVWTSIDALNLLQANSDDLNNFTEIMKEKISEIEKQDITVSNLAEKIETVQNQIQNEKMPDYFKGIGKALAKAVIKPNYAMDANLTKARRDKAYEDAIRYNKVMIKKGDRIINKGDIVTSETLQMLNSLSLLEKSGIDILFSLGLLAILFLLSLVIVVYMNHFCRDILYSRGDLILLGFIIIITLLISRFIYALSPLAIPLFLAVMLISILLDMKLAIMINFVLIVAISFITKGDMSFLTMAMISGTMTAFIVSRANQRNKLFMSGVIVGVINILVILSMIGVEKIKMDRNEILLDILIVFLNGVGSIIVTIGLLPFLESTFNIITPLKLLELANPNQPLIKRLLMEAPGTYHHSLMVGNLAEVATEAIGGNALLSRVGAYFHDIGKLKRPNFFKENQMSDNPHDRMTANLSTLVITSHTNDGVELAVKHKIPLAIRDIIQQHHGTTLVVYFYHKAKKGEKSESVVQDSFRYSGPKPSSKEAAVVMLADSVEAAVRSMVDKTEGKIEGLVRKLIKDKLDDGQLDQCNLTLKDLDDIAKGFMKVLSGIFHEREEYPEIEEKRQDVDIIKDVNNITDSNNTPSDSEGGQEIAGSD